MTSLRLLVLALVALLAAEVVVMSLYVREVRRAADLEIALEYERGTALVAQAMAQRCVAPAPIVVPWGSR